MHQARLQAPSAYADFASASGDAAISRCGYMGRRRSLPRRWLLWRQLLEEREHRVAGLLMLAGSITGSEVDLRKCEGLECLVVLASEDTVVPPNGRAEDGSLVRVALATRCPRRTKCVTIEGANHAGFADYGPQRFPFPDGEARITRFEQQQQTVRHVAAFVRKLSVRVRPALSK